MDLNIKNIKTTELSSNDLEEISKIFKSSFQISVKPSSLYKKYVSNFFGFSFHSIVRNSKDELIGIYTFSPKIFSINNKKIKALQSLDTCFPQKGLVNPFLLKKVVNDLVNYAKNNISDLSFIYGFPNSKYEKLSKYFLNWKYVLTLYSYLEIFPLIRLLYFSFFRNNKYNNILKIIPNYDEVKTRVKSDLHCNLNIFKINLLTIWITKNPFYLQIFNISFYTKDYYPNKKIDIFNKLYLISRLFIPSVSSTTNKPCWLISKFLPKFNLYAISLNDDLDFKKLYLDVNFLWNDVP